MTGDQLVRLLLIEHRPEDIRRMRRLLANAHAGPVEVAVADRLTDAFELLQHDKFDVVLLDLRLPDAHGLEGVDRLHDLCPDIPVVVLSEPGDDVIAMQAVDHGALEFIVRNASGGDQLMSVIRQAIARKRSEKRLTALALRDPLTGVANRTLLAERLERAKLRAKREQQSFAVLFLDLNGFKHVNDTLGHEFGDRVLLGMARRLETVLRGVDTIARFGGDEFVMVAEGLKRPGDAGLVAQKALKAIVPPFEIAGHQLHLGASIGICLFPHDTTDLDDLIRLADAAMYVAKRTGRNQIVFHGQSEDEGDGAAHGRPPAPTGLAASA